MGSTRSQVNRRDFLKMASAVAAAAATANATGEGGGPTTRSLPPSTSPAGKGEPIALSTGPHLFIDDYLIDESTGLSRIVHSPDRLDQPVLDNPRFGTTQPYLSIFPNDGKDGYRAWYNRLDALWHAESNDAVKWSNPRVVWDLPRSFGASLLDDGPRCPDPQRRFKLANWQNTQSTWQKPNDDSGMYVGFSPDGFTWTPHSGNPVLPMWPEGYDKLLPHGAGDIVDVWRDPFNGNRYTAALKTHGLVGEFPMATRSGFFSRRLVGLTSSDDFVNWSPLKRIFVPDARDEGLLEFYGMGGVHARGPLLIGLVRVLRDDLSPEPGGEPAGIGYTVLATSRDGVTWTRDRMPFMDRNPKSGTWDRAMTWASTVLPVGDELLVYYGGYARGHKEGNRTERQIGLARMVRDRYVARAAGAATGRLRTPLLSLDGEKLTINANVKGELRVSALNDDGKPFAGFEPLALQGDSLAHDSKQNLTSLRGKRVRLEFTLRDAELYGFTLS